MLRRTLPLLVAAAAMATATPSSAQRPKARPAPPAPPTPSVRPTPELPPTPTAPFVWEAPETDILWGPQHFDIAPWVESFEIPAIWDLPLAVTPEFELRWPGDLAIEIPDVQVIEPVIPEPLIVSPEVRVEWSDELAVQVPDVFEHQFDAWRDAASDLAWAPRGRSALLRQEPRDSLYRRARDLLNKGEYRKAADTFAEYEKTASERYLVASMYWRAFALYRAGTEADLRLAATVLAAQQERFPAVRNDADVTALVTRVTGALAARGDASAARRLRQNAQQVESCDKEDMEVRAEALSALMQTDASSAAQVVGRLLDETDECAVPLRRRAVYLLGREGSAESAAKLARVAASDPSDQVRSDAIGRLSQFPGTGTVPTLERLFANATEETTKRAIVSSLRRVEDPAAITLLKRIIEREDEADRVRVDAIGSLARSSASANPVIVTGSSDRRVLAVSSERKAMSEPDAAFLRAQYGRTSSRAVRSAILQSLARYGQGESDQWLMGVVRDSNEDMRFRATALSHLRRADVPVVQLGQLYDRLTERELRSTLVSILGSRKEDEATDKLIEIARRGTDPSIRRAAIAALSRKKDPRTTQLLLELVEK
ncbi:MAG: HEAT repeat domain-containing protein [Gemmatimonadales bacterium]